MIRLRLYNQSSDACILETPVFSATFPRSLSKSGKWSVTIPLIQDSYNLLNDSVYAEIYFGETYGIGGRILKVVSNFQTGVVDIQGYEELDALYDESPDSDLYLYEQNFIAQLFTILQLSGWRFGRYRDINRTKIVTLDLRKETSRLAQFAALLKQEPDLQYRFGGFDVDGQPMLDVSLFDDPVKHTVFHAKPAEQANSVVINTVKTTDDYTNRMYAIEVVGGDITPLVATANPRPVRLGDALTNDPSLMFDPDYPIYENNAGTIYTIIPTREGPIGGRVASVPQSGASATPIIGETSGAGTANRWAQYVFKPVPGRLTELSFWIPSGATVGTEAYFKSFGPFQWQLCLATEADIKTPGTVIAEGVIPNENWSIGTGRSRVTFEDYEIDLEEGTRYMFRCGYVTTPATGQFMRIAFHATNSTNTFAYSYSNLPFSVFVAQPGMPKLEVVTAPTVPIVGKRGVIFDTRLIATTSDPNNFSTLAEIKAAGKYLYEWAIKQIDNTQVYKRTMDIDLVGFDLSWQPGDSVYIGAELDFIEGRVAAHEIRTIESITYTAADQIMKMQVTLQPNIPDEEEEDNEVEIVQKTKKKSPIKSGSFFVPPYTWEVTEITSVVQYTVADTAMTDGTPAVTVSFTLPAPPAGKFETTLIGTPYAIHSNTAVQIESEVVSKSETSVVVRIAIAGGVTWTVYDAATVYCHIAWR